MESIISTFHIDWKIIIAQAVNFGIVFAILYIFALKPLGKLMKERGEKIAKGIDDAKVNAEILERTRAESEKMLREAKAEVGKIFELGKKEVRAERATMIENAKTEAGAILENGRKALEAQKIKTIEEAKKDIVSIAMLAAEKLMKDETRLKDL